MTRWLTTWKQEMLAHLKRDYRCWPKNSYQLKCQFTFNEDGFKEIPKVASDQNQISWPESKSGLDNWYWNIPNSCYPQNQCWHVRDNCNEMLLFCCVAFNGLKMDIAKRLKYMTCLPHLPSLSLIWVQGPWGRSQSRTTHNQSNNLLWG